jgi:ZIP family zinc transporter
MGGAFFWAFVGASSLILGGAIACYTTIRPRLLGLIMAFGGGVLISAVAYELVLDAFRLTHGGAVAVAFGLLAGALTFYAGDTVIDRMGGAERKQLTSTATDDSALPIVLGTVLDGIPESVVLGLTLIGGEEVSVAMLAAIFLSNLPEAIAGSAGLIKGSWSRRRVLGMWTGMAVVSGLAALIGFALFDTASPGTVAFVEAFAGGAILTMLADSMFPEAYKHGGNQVGLVTTLGFFLAFFISTLE